MPTKDELEAELAAANERIAELEATNAEQLPAAPRPPAQPDFGLSAGEVSDLENAGVTTSPFTGKQLNALDEGIEPSNPEARRNAERARAARLGEKLPDRAAPPAGPDDLAAANG
jgi:hypothetical protein